MDRPLATRMRPRNFKEFVGHHHLLGEGKPLTKLIDGGHLPSTILWGPPGTGKTTLAHLLAVAVGADFQQLSAVSSGVSDARRVMDHSKTTLFRTVLFVDEVHRWNKAQQEILLPAIEDGSITLIGATTENPYHSLVGPLLSRCLLLRLEPLEAEEVRGLLELARRRRRAGDGRAGRVAHRRRARSPRRALRGRRPGRAHRPRGRGPARRRGRDRDRRRAGGRRRPEADRRLRPRRQPLRRRLRVHQEHAGLRPGRDAVLARPDDPCGRRPPIHRAADDDLRLRGRRARRPTGAVGRRRGGARARARRHARGSFQPRARRRCTSRGRPSRTRSPTRWTRRWSTPTRPIPSRRICATRTTRARPSSGTAKGYEYPHDFEGHHVEQQYRPERFEDAGYYEPTGQGEEVEVEPGTGAPVIDARTSRRSGRTEASPEPWVCWANAHPRNIGGNG